MSKCGLDECDLYGGCLYNCEPKKERMGSMSKSGRLYKDELDKRDDLIQELTNALIYWMPVDEPLSEQTDNISKAHKSLWNKHQMLIAEVKG